MNLHEFQGKQILSSYGVRVQRGHVANTAEEAVTVAKQLTEETGTGWHVIKAQIHAGGRGKGTMKEVPTQHGVQVIKSAEDAENVLRVKASVRDFEPETNFSVITNDGRFYSFNVYYSSYPEAMSYDLLTMQKAVDKVNGNDVLFEELGNNSPSLAGLLLETIYKKDKRIVKHIGAKSFGIQFILKGIYIHNGKYYFHTELRNRTNVPFQIDFVNFKVVDKKVAKRTVVQERPIIPLRTYKPLDEIGGKLTEQNVFLLDQFTIADDKILLIEIFEKNGGRHQTLQIENCDLIKARLINDMHLKF